MSDPKADRFLRVTGLVIFYMVSAFVILNFLFIVPKFEQIFADAIPGKPLPIITQIIIGHKYALAFVALVLPLACTLLFLKQKPYALLLINLGLFWSLLEIGIVWVSLVMPMVGGGISGMSDAH